MKKIRKIWILDLWRRRAWCEGAGLFPCVPYRRRRASTSVYVRRRT